jgi:hypothetical protein
MFVDVASDIFRQIEVEYRNRGQLRGYDDDVISRREEFKSFIDENIINNIDLSFTVVCRNIALLNSLMVSKF